MGLNRRNLFFLFWSFIGAIALLVIWHLPWRFQVNDDVIMMWLVSGAYTGQPESYAIFIHPFLSWFLSELYIIQPKINWYGGIWFSVIYFSYFLLIYLISGWQTCIWTKSTIALLMLLIAIHFSFFPQFTYVAGFGAFASICFYFINSRNDNIFYTLLSIFVFILSVMIRLESVALIGIGFGVFKITTRFKTIKKINFTRYFLFVFLFLFFTLSKIYLEQNSEFAEFLTFNKIRSLVIDHPVFFQEVKENSINESTDFFFFSRWFFEADSPTINELTEKKMALDREYYSFRQFVNSLTRIWYFQKSESFKSFLILSIFIVLFLSSKYEKRVCAFIFSWISIFLLLNHIFLFQGRVIILFFISILFAVFSQIKIKIKFNFALALIVMFLFALGLHFIRFQKEAKGRLIMDSEFVYLRKSIKDKIPIIIEGYQESNSEINHTLRNQVPFLITGWISRSPFQERALNRFGFQSFEDIDEFVLVTPTTNSEIVFPSYMSFSYGEFQIMDSIQTNNFKLFKFFKK